MFAKTLLIGLVLSATAGAAVHTVIMKSISYDPKRLEIKVGDSVKWTNQSYTDHSAATVESAAFDTGKVAPKETSKEILFSSPGTYRYHCRVHGNAMSGMIIVNP